MEEIEMRLEQLEKVNVDRKKQMDKTDKQLEGLEEQIKLMNNYMEDVK